MVLTVTRIYPNYLQRPLTWIYTEISRTRSICTLSEKRLSKVAIQYILLHERESKIYFALYEEILFPEHIKSKNGIF